MKKYSFLFLLITQLLFLTSCSVPKASSPSETSINTSYSRRGSNQGIVNAVSYIDGTYIGNGDLKDYGKEVATITIDGGKITNVVYQRLDSSGKEVLRTESSNVKIESLGKELSKNDIKSDINILVNEVVKKQSYDVSIPTSNKDLLLNWRLAVKRAVEQAKK